MSICKGLAVDEHSIDLKAFRPFSSFFKEFVSKGRVIMQRTGKWKVCFTYLVRVDQWIGLTGVVWAPTQRRRRDRKAYGATSDSASAGGHRAQNSECEPCEPKLLLSNAM